MTSLTTRYVDAVAYAVDVHTGQVRKGTAVPYAAHLLGVSSLVLEAGGDEDLAIAALLHDAAEDHGGQAQLAEITARFGSRVSLIVAECSDSLLSEDAPKPAWQSRKVAHLARLESASDDTLLVWTSDKVHNARALVTDVSVFGVDVLSKFHAGAEQILWYYRSNLDLALRRQVTDILVRPLRLALDELDELITAATSVRQSEITPLA